VTKGMGVRFASRSDSGGLSADLAYSRLGCAMSYTVVGCHSDLQACSSSSLGLDQVMV
jgi:hypothetical protein